MTARPPRCLVPEGSFVKGFDKLDQFLKNGSWDTVKLSDVTPDAGATASFFKLTTQPKSPALQWCHPSSWTKNMNSADHGTIKFVLSSGTGDGSRHCRRHYLSCPALRATPQQGKRLCPAINHPRPNLPTEIAALPGMAPRSRSCRTSRGGIT